MADAAGAAGASPAENRARLLREAVRDEPALRLTAQLREGGACGDHQPHRPVEIGWDVALLPLACRQEKVAHGLWAALPEYLVQAPSKLARVC